MVLLGDSADTRKSTAMKKTTMFYTEALADFSICFGVGSAEGLCEKFLQNNRVLLVYDELRTFVNKAKIETSVLLQAVNSLFELNTYESATKKHSIEIKDAHLSLLGASTPETYSTMFSSQFLDIGFINRLFVIQDHGQKMWSLPPKVSLDEKDQLKKHLGELLKLITDAAQGGIIEMSLTGEAGERWDEYYFDMPTGPSAKRLDTYGLRLLLLLAINDGKTKVDLETVEKVITILNYEYDIRKMVDPIDADTKVAELEQRLRRIIESNGQGINLRDLQRAVHYERYGIFIFNSAKNNLLRAQEMIFDSKTKRFYAMDS
jgi:hypothetical protein